MYRHDPACFFIFDVILRDVRRISCVKRVITLPWRPQGRLLIVRMITECTTRYGVREVINFPGTFDIAIPLFREEAKIMWLLQMLFTVLRQPHIL